MILGIWHSDVWTYLWLLWGAMFLFIELPGYFLNKPGDAGRTLSEHIWAFFGWGQNKTTWIEIRRMVGISFWAILTVHFFLMLV